MSKNTRTSGSVFYTIFCVATAMVGYTIHHNYIFSFFNFLFAPISWIFWLLGHDVNLSIIKETFSFFLR
jgi:hypothetical protein